MRSKSARHAPRGSNDRLKRVVIVGHIVTGNLHLHAVVFPTTAAFFRGSREYRLAYRGMFDQIHKW